MMVPEALALSAVLFSIGVIGVLTRRNAIIIFMCVELMLNAVNLTFLAFARYGAAPGMGSAEIRQSMMGGQMAVIFVMAVAAAEVAVGLGIIMAIFRLKNQADVDDMSALRG